LRTGIGDFDPVAGRLVDIEEERALDGVLVGAGFDEDAILEEDVGGAQDIVALVGGVGNMMKAAAHPGMVLGHRHVVALVVDGEPAPGEAAAVEADLFGYPAAEGWSP
jgi:hypothetical protein